MELIQVGTLVAAVAAAIASMVAAARAGAVTKEPPMSKTALEDHLMEESKPMGLSHLTREEVRFFTGELRNLGYWD